MRILRGSIPCIVKLRLDSVRHACLSGLKTLHSFCTHCVCIVLLITEFQGAVWRNCTNHEKHATISQENRLNIGCLNALRDTRLVFNVHFRPQSPCEAAFDCERRYTGILTVFAYQRAYPSCSLFTLQLLEQSWNMGHFVRETFVSGFSLLSKLGC